MRLYALLCHRQTLGRLANPKAYYQLVRLQKWLQGSMKCLILPTSLWKTKRYRIIYLFHPSTVFNTLLQQNSSCRDLSKPKILRVRAKEHLLQGLAFSFSHVLQSISALRYTDITCLVFASRNQETMFRKSMLASRILSY